MTVPLASGYTCCVQVQAVDRGGNTSPWRPVRCTTRPVDDRGLATSAGWSRLRGATERQDDLAVADPQRHPEEGGYVPSARGRCHDVPDRRQHLGLLPPVVINRAATITIKVTTSGKPVLIDGLGIARA